LAGTTNLPKTFNNPNHNLCIVFLWILVHILDTFLFTYLNILVTNYLFVCLFVCRDCRCVYSNVSERTARPGWVLRSLLHACATSRTAEAQWLGF
jgi:hypothetical protein